MDKSRRCQIAVLVDEEVGSRDKGGSFVVDAGSMEEHVLNVLRRGATTAVVPFVADIIPTINELRALKPRLVFNLTEWLDGDRRQDASIAGVLDMMKLRYTGSNAEGMHLARDKALAKQIVSRLGIDVAPHRVVNGRVGGVSDMRFPVIVKPQFGDGSDEIGKAALASTAAALKTRIASIRRRTREPLLCEEFIEGCDVLVGLLGNEPRVMPPLELVIGRQGRSAPRFMTSKVKNDKRYQARWGVRYRHAELPAAVRRRIDEASRAIFHALKLRDYARIDYRLTDNNRLVFLEANPNPDIAPHTFGRDQCFAGVPYPQLISTIVQAALSRPK